MRRRQKAAQNFNRFFFFVTLFFCSTPSVNWMMSPNGSRHFMISLGNRRWVIQFVVLLKNRSRFFFSWCDILSSRRIGLARVSFWCLRLLPQRAEISRQWMVVEFEITILWLVLVFLSKISRVVLGSWRSYFTGFGIVLWSNKHKYENTEAMNPYPKRDFVFRMGNLKKAFVAMYNHCFAKLKILFCCCRCQIPS